MSATGSVPAGVLTGVVTDEHGHPVAEASVSLVDAPVPVPDIAALTGPDGRFTLAAPSPGRYTVAAVGPDGAAARAAVDVGVAGAPAQLRLVVGGP
jgi:hypothetical protein